ncbi:DNA alkylation repair protein [Aquabacterium sp. OR-4]|uniref:DNA alkylation repair protein n=1 Tax=Aquabacterium sp. OR-4 TaxID=2978127 RepID=UPI0021B22D53|nr:DNA alkylation repair protein [Aquabacterium sp. OR-4]MDT7835739.1 DNA alkylation repair protein [Aquabacterium sp. OR-4]
MAEPFKNLINPDRVAEAGAHLQRAWPGFDAAGFQALACQGLEALEMKARAMQIADALQATLPADFGAAATVIEAALAPVVESPEALQEGWAGTAAAGLSGWILWPVGEFVARQGIDEPQRALQALQAITQRFTAEFAIRPFIVRHPALVFDTLAQWLHHPSAHVRRLVSEGSRPRLPWGLRLQALVADPTPTLALLRALQDDPSEYVRRSVANHLNDIAKDHPARVAGWLAEHLPGAPPERRALLRHASRSLIKAGDAAVLAAWGQAEPLRGRAALAVAPARIRVGEAITLGITLASTAPRPQHLVIDYAVHHAKADGQRTAKVFKGWVIDLAPGEQRQLDKRHSFRPVTVRRYHPGAHAVDLRVNGQVLAQAEFLLDA